MENVPSKPDDESHKGKSSGKKKETKRTEALGIFAMAQDSIETGEGGPKAESAWDKLTLTRRRAGETKETVSLSQALQAEEVSRQPELDEKQAEVLSPAEEHFAATKFIEAERETPHDHFEEEAGEGEAIMAAEAVELFRSKVADEGKSVNEAFSETIHDLENLDGAASSPEAVGAQNSTGAGEEQISDEARLAPGEVLEASGVSGDERENTTDNTDPDRPALDGQKRGVEAQAKEARIPGADPSQNTLPAAPIPLTGYAGARHKAASPSKPEHVAGYDSSDVLGAALVVGLVGYLIGRRRGRIKTERKLRPIRKKLEKQVKELRQDIQAKEVYIRSVAARQTRDRKRIIQMEQMQEKSAKKTEEARSVALEASQLHGKKVSPEIIGQVIVAAGKGAEKAKKAPEKPRAVTVKEGQAKTMNRAELLDLSEGISVENTTLRQVYETHLVTEQGLRRLVDEYARGGDVQTALRQELVEQEIDFERDPMLRDKIRPVADQDTESMTLHKLLQKANAFGEAQVKDETAVLKARQAHHEIQRQRQQRSRRVLDVSMVAAITVLFILVVMLLLEGR